MSGQRQGALIHLCQDLTFCKTHLCQCEEPGATHPCDGEVPNLTQLCKGEVPSFTHLCQCEVWKLLEGELVLLPRVPKFLSLENPCRRDGGETHAISHEQDHILCRPRTGRLSGCQNLLQLSTRLRVPELPVCNRRVDIHSLSSASDHM